MDIPLNDIFISELCDLQNLDDKLLLSLGCHGLITFFILLIYICIRISFGFSMNYDFVDVSTVQKGFRSM